MFIWATRLDTNISLRWQFLYKLIGTNVFLYEIPLGSRIEIRLDKLLYFFTDPIRFFFDKSEATVGVTSKFCVRRCGLISDFGL